MITDDMLSAFLDNALSAGDMERVRDAMAQDLALADRLAELAQVDMVVKKAADVATRRPLPAAVVHLLGQHSMDATHGNNTKHTQVTRKELPFADTERQFDGSGEYHKDSTAGCYPSSAFDFHSLFSRFRLVLQCP